MLSVQFGEPIGPENPDDAKHHETFFFFPDKQKAWEAEEQLSNLETSCAEHSLNTN